MIATKNEGTRRYVRGVQSITPNGIESRFEYDELFFSITDPKSKITFANETFIRISKFEPNEVIGQLHKLVRHPDMPRCIFNVFWNYLKQNKVVAAYVKNLSKDGSYYWVLALAFPCKEGYLSIRLKPGSPLFNSIRNLYKETLSYEKELEKETDKKRAMLGAEKYFVQQLEKMGFQDYDGFMREALQKEMHHREEELAKMNRSSSRDPNIVPTRLTELEQNLAKLFHTTDKLKQIQITLLEQSDYILKLARSILLISINAQVSSSKLDRNDLSLSVVAEKMGEQTLLGEKQLVNLKENIFGLSDLIRTLNFAIISSKLQLEIEIYFKQELSNNSGYYNSFITTSDTATALLSEAYKPHLEQISVGISDVTEYLSSISLSVQNIERFLMVLRFIHITGKVEIAGMNDSSNSFSTTFQELITEITNAETRLKTLSAVISDNKFQFAGILKMKNELDTLKSII